MTQNSPHANSVPEEWLSAYLDDELSADQRQLVEAAVKEQPQLAQLLDELIATRRLIQQLPAFPTSSSRRTTSNTKSTVADLDDGLDSEEDSSNSNNLASASDRQLEQRLADDRPIIDLARSDENGSSSRLSWRMLTLAASLIGVAALGATMWYQSDRWSKLAFDTSSDNRVSSAMIPEGLVDKDSGPKAFGGVENQVAPTAAPATDAPSMQRSRTEGGMGALGSGISGQEFAGGLGEGGMGGGGYGTGGLGGGGLGGGLDGSAGAAPAGNTPTSQPFDFTPRTNDQQFSQKESFNQLHEDAPNLNTPRMPAEPPARGLAGNVPSNLLGVESVPGGGDQFGAPNALENLKANSPSAGAMSAEPISVPQLPSASPSINSPAPSDLAMEFRAAPKQGDATLGNAAPGAPSPAASAPTDPAKPAPVNDPGPVANPKTMLDQLLNSGQSVEPLPSPAASNVRAMQGMKAKDGSRGSVESGPAGKAESTRGLDAANPKLAAPSAAPSATPSAPTSKASLSEAQSNDAAKGEALKKSLLPKSEQKNQVLTPKSALYRSPAWSEAAVTAQLDGNPLYRPMLSLLSDSNKDKSLKLQSDAKANQADDSVLTAVVRLTANQRSAVIEQSKQLGIEPAIKDDAQTAWVLFLSATELDRILESANQQEKLNIFWISPAKQSASGDRRVLIVNPF